MRGRFRSRGYSRYVDEHGRLHENDTFTCRHCQRLVDKAAFTRVEDIAGVCAHCNAPICPVCIKRGQCDPFEEKMKRIEASYHARRSYGLI